MLKRILYGVILNFIVLHVDAFSGAGALFKVATSGAALPETVSYNLCLTINGQYPLSCQKLTTEKSDLAINTTIPNQTYFYVGLKINTPGYIYTPQPSGNNIQALGNQSLASGYILIGEVSDQKTVYGVVKSTTNQAPSITSANNTQFTYNEQSQFIVTAIGIPVPTLSEEGALPSGVTFTDNHNGTATIAGVPTNSGTYDLTIIAQNGALPNAVQPFTLNVNKGNQTITFTSTAPSNAAVGGATYTPTATSSSGLTVSLSVDNASNSVCTMTSGVVSFIATGTCVINANQSGDGNYNPAAQVQQSFTVKENQTITFTSTAPSNATVGGATYTPTATSSSGLTVSLSVDNASSSVCTMTSGVVWCHLLPQGLV